MKATVPGSTRWATYPLGMSADERSVYVVRFSPAFSGVERVDPDGRETHIKAFADPVNYQALGHADGRYLVWYEYHSLYGLDDFTVFSYDSSTGKVRAIGSPRRDAQGNIYPSPWSPPVVSQGVAAYGRGTSGGLTEVVAVNLATGVRRVVRVGHAQAPLMWGASIVWPESPKPAALTQLFAVNGSSGLATSLPEAIKQIRGTPVVALADTQVAYLDPERRSLLFSSSLTEPAHVILRLPSEETFQDMHLSRQAIVFTTTAATYVADLRTWSYTRLVTNGAAQAQNHSILVGEAPKAKTGHPINPLHLVRDTAPLVERCAGHS